MTLVKELISSGYLVTPRLIEAFEKIKRQDFLKSGQEHEAEINAPISIGYGQTVSQPLTVAFMFELLQPHPGENILDTGSGSGWTTALLASIVGELGRVYAVEVIPELKIFGENNVAKYNFVKKGIVRFFCMDGRLGLPDYAPFDRILVSAASVKIPETLIEQLKIGGRMVIPIGDRNAAQDLAVIDKLFDGSLEESRYPGFIFVPLR